MNAARHQAFGAFVFAASALMAVVAARVFYIANYGVDFPFWDQWDAEVDALLRPWLDGSLRWNDLFAPHNEHRIFFTRLLALGLFELNGQRYSNLLSAYSNIGLLGLILAPALVALWRGSPSRFAAVVVGVMLSVWLILPLDWNNMLVGFQSQFYFLLGFTVLGIAATACMADGWRLRALFTLSAAAPLLCMASGVLTAPALLWTALLRTWCGRLSWRSFSVYAAIAIVFAVLGLLWLPAVPAHAGLKSQSLGELLAALQQVLAWPMQGSPWTALIVQAPLWLAAIYALWLRRAEPIDLAFLGIGSWALLQALAMAYSRGADLQVIPSRYAGLLIAGLASSLWFVGRATASIGRLRAAPGWSLALLACAWFLAVVTGTAMQSIRAWAELNTFARDFQIQERNLGLYLAGIDPEALSAPPMQIPYPDGARLRGLLAHAQIRAMLPTDLTAAVREAMPQDLAWTADAEPEGSALPVTPELSGAAVVGGYHASAGEQAQTWGSWAGADEATGRVTLRVAAGCGDVLLPLVRGPAATGLRFVVRWIDASASQRQAALNAEELPQSWRRLRIERPQCGAIEIEATDEGTGWGQWLALGAPLSAERG